MPSRTTASPSWLKRPCRCLNALLKDTNGAAAVFIAAALPMLIGLVGLGIDSTRLYNAHSKLQSAVDSAALAGSLQLPYDPDLSKGLVSQEVNTYLHKNYADATLTNLAQGTEARSVEVEASAQVNTLLLHMFGTDSRTIEAKAVAGFNNLEIVFVIDNSGSMRGAPIQETNEAASSLVDLILPDGLESSVKVGLVPFRGKVRIGDGVDGLPAGCRNADGSYNWDLNDEYLKPEYRYPEDSRLRVSSGTCSGIPPVHALTTDKTAIINAIQSQDARGAASGTVISEGIKWGRHVLTPESPYTEGSNEPDMRRVMILLTDGDTEDGECGGNYRAWYYPNNYWTNAYYGMLDMDSHCENGGVLNQAVIDEAEAAKAAGIEVFCIRYGNSDTTDRDIMKQIASSKPGTEDHYYDAPSPYDIGDIFKKIGRQLGWRLLS